MLINMFTIQISMLVHSCHNPIFINDLTWWKQLILIMEICRSAVSTSLQIFGVMIQTLKCIYKCTQVQSKNRCAEATWKTGFRKTKDPVRVPPFEPIVLSWFVHERLSCKHRNFFCARSSCLPRWLCLAKSYWKWFTDSYTLVAWSLHHKVWGNHEKGMTPGLQSIGLGETIFSSVPQIPTGLASFFVFFPRTSERRVLLIVGSV